MSPIVSSLDAVGFPWMGASQVSCFSQSEAYLALWQVSFIACMVHCPMSDTVPTKIGVVSHILQTLSHRGIPHSIIFPLSGTYNWRQSFTAVVTHGLALREWSTVLLVSLYHCLMCLTWQTLPFITLATNAVLFHRMQVCGMLM